MVDSYDITALKKGDNSAFVDDWGWGGTTHVDAVFNGV